MLLEKALESGNHAKRELLVKLGAEVESLVVFHALEIAIQNVDSKDIAEFLKFVAEGEQDKAEDMLKANFALALVPGNVTDLSKRTFTNITGFQYAVWALDWHMWTMIKNYLPDDAAIEQLIGFGTGSWVKNHGAYAKELLDNLIKAYQFTLDIYIAAKYAEGDTAWVQQVGGAQLLLPAHVINEYCHPTRPFYPLPNFRNALALPRTRTIDEGEWFTALYNGGKLGDKFAVQRDVQRARGWGGGRQAYKMFPSHDYNTIRALISTRKAQRKELITELKAKAAAKQTSKIMRLESAINRESIQTAELKTEIERLNQSLQSQQQVQSVRFEQLEKAFSSREEKGRAELQEKLQIGKSIAISQFKNFKKISKSSLKDLLIKTLQGHASYVQCLQLLPSGELVSGGDGPIKVWDLQTGSCIKTLQGHTNGVVRLQLSLNGELISGSLDHTIKVWNVLSGECLKTLQGHTNYVWCLQQLPSGELVSGSFDNTIKVWDLKSGNCLKTLQGHTDGVGYLQLLPSGELVSGSYDNTIKVWNLQSGSCLKTLQGHTNNVMCLQLLLSGELVSSSHDNTIKVWDLQSGNCLKTLQGHTKGIFCLQLLPSGELVSGSYDNTIKVWDLQSGNCLKTLTGHTNVVYCLQLLPSGELVSGSHDTTIKVWDLTEYGNVLDKELEKQLSSCAMQ